MVNDAKPLDVAYFFIFFHTAQTTPISNVRICRVVQVQGDADTDVYRFIIYFQILFSTIHIHNKLYRGG